MIKCAQYTQLCQSEWISFTVGTARGCSAAMCGYVCSQAIVRILSKPYHMTHKKGSLCIMARNDLFLL